MKIPNNSRFNWRLPFYAVIFSIVVVLPIELCNAFDIGEILYFGVVAPITSLLLLVLAIGKKSLSILSMLMAYCAVSLALLKGSYDLRTSSRWFLWSHRFKAEVLAQPDSSKGYLKHIEWDGWGFPGAGDTYVYIVFDPSDSLSRAAKNDSPGKYSGIPCEVSGVRRLESHWYSVVFDTDTSWFVCN